jgi:hypothetical protein
VTVQNSDRVDGPFVANGMTNPALPFTFKVFNDTDVVVIQQDADGVDTTLTITTHYTVTLNEDQDDDPGGDVNLVSTPTLNYKHYLTSSVPPTQTAEFTNQGGFSPAVLNPALDKAVILIQELRRDMDLSISAPVTDPSSSNLELPSAEERANKVLGFDDDGDPIAVEMASLEATDFMRDVLQAEDGDEALEALGVDADLLPVLQAADTDAALEALGGGAAGIDVFKSATSDDIKNLLGIVSGSLNINPVVFDTPGADTYTKPAGLIGAFVITVGGGGGGGGAESLALGESTLAVGGGGGGGEMCVSYLPAASIGSTETVTVGAAGTGGTSAPTDGNAGGISSFGTLCVANGGAGGGKNENGNPPDGGGDGGSGGTANIFSKPGQGGYFGMDLTSTEIAGPLGWGGSSGLGFGGTGAVQAPSGYGAGGGGQNAVSGGSGGGTAGTAGVVIVIEIKIS